MEEEKRREGGDINVRTIVKTKGMRKKLKGGGLRGGSVLEDVGTIPDKQRYCL